KLCPPRDCRPCLTGNKVLVIGGTGHFGKLLIEDLRRYTVCDVVAPGRQVLDLSIPATIDTALPGTSVAICAAGPFQTLPATLVERCLRHGIHYLDLADDRIFVRKVRSLVASQPGDVPAICSGWSTAPALSGSLARIGAAGLDRIEEIYIHMA